MSFCKMSPTDSITCTLGIKLSGIAAAGTIRHSCWCKVCRAERHCPETSVKHCLPANINQSGSKSRSTLVLSHPTEEYK